VTLQATLVEPVAEILLSLLIGGAIGFALALAMRFFRSHANRLCLILTAVVLGTALAEQFDLSSLLLCMSIGAVLVNLRDDAEKLLTYNDDWTPPLFLLFFVLSGADLDLTALPAIGLLGVLYLVLRSVGKYVGAWMGARMVHAQPNICKYLGVTLLPQAGVAIGMSQIVISALPAYGAAIRTVVLCATLIYELVGPLLTKIALTKAGEIVPAKHAGKQISNA
jgi:Kef-type K+ transport system membrane component KefB